jgi:hypothetical protein
LAVREKKISPVAHVLARVGCFSIGTVYVLIGVWAMLALLRVADPAADEGRILRRMMDFPFGAVFIALVAGGTLGYVLWLIFEAVFDPYQFGNGWKGLAERIGIGLSTLAYAGIVSAAVQVLLGGGGDGEKRNQMLAARVLQWPGGHWVMGAAGLLVAVAGLYQVKYVWDGDHKRRLELHGRGRLACLVINVLAWTGYCARCVILLVLGWFILRATWSSNPRAVGDTDSAFDFLGLNGGRLGDAVFSAVAFGTIGYGLFMYVNGVYFRFSQRQGRSSKP